ncbi:DUF502 domain-containing protein [Polaromonas sp.]|uniref:DUF502 domain-containing protein n=1 Tax=Polaromonas sp. TaxID=1869339 RepID=UPI002FC76381
MKLLSKYFFRGLITVLPVALTLYLLYIFVAWMEGLSLWLLRPLIGSFYVPGLGLVFAMLGIFAIGVLVSRSSVRRMLSFAELPFTNIPVVKSIYSSLKSFADYFSPTSKHGSQQVVILRMPGHAMEMVGLITRRSFADLPAGFLPGERVAVYLPMGYMIGGYTVFVPAEWVQPIAMSVEEAMRSALIAWMARPDAGPANPASQSAADAAPSQ